MSPCQHPEIGIGLLQTIIDIQVLKVSEISIKLKMLLTGVINYLIA